MFNKTNFIIIWKSINISLFFVFLFILNGCSQKNDKVYDGKISVNGIEIYYRTAGEGIPTFVLHGGPGDSHSTMLQLKALSDKCKIIFYDQRAAGKSTGDELIETHTVEQFVEDLEQLRLKFSSGKINIIGGSWGTLVAMKYAMKYSENINAMVLLSTLGYSSEFFEIYRANIKSKRLAEDAAKLEQISQTVEFKNGLPETMAEFWRIYFKAYFYNPDLVDNLDYWLRDTSYKRVPGRYAKLGEFISNYDIRSDLKNINCPTLILHGDYDATPIEWVQPIHENIAGSQMTIIKNAGHWLWVEAPDQVLPLIHEFFNAN